MAKVGYTHLQSPINSDPHITWDATNQQFKVQAKTGDDCIQLLNPGGTAVFVMRCDGANNGKLTMRDNGGSTFLETNNVSALLALTSSTQGFLPPAMTTAQKNAIGTPAAGLIVFDTTLGKLCVYSGAAWQTITSV